MIPDTITVIALIPEPLMVLLLAVAMDLILGEPPARVHPVVIIGGMIGFLKRRARLSRIEGAEVALLVILSAAAAGHLLIEAGDRVSFLGFSLGVVVSAYLLKATMAIRCLLDTSEGIGRLVEEDLDEAKKLLSALVSRNPEGLTRTQATSAVIESLSENYVDTVVSPLFYYLLFTPFGLGVEAALAFKAVNTLDSMLGYRTEELKDLGFASARLDDLANWVPARLSLPIIAAARPSRAKVTIETALRDHARTPSPNSGWPMAAAAGALGLRLEKPGVYVVGDGGRDPSTEDIKLALRLVGTAMGLTVACSSLILLSPLFL
ncbi:MAG: cobalamin biosynthesis protein [Methanothrix sp.]|jgi:adenosylcobinamide-phosphate synthase|uniref:Probable cobalamin biosynthesis protein CobD n=1 Tax=Methanothrix harundinacea TaxID=301375 RepID=A0A101FS45_9EURY|nr:MAG: cobalamin biosynthesis protein CobD [Methanosaeta sp. SDB]KUK43329.1 MAG: putative cobalamin biosynthesis protein CobD [Methanothrix harundinacea]MDD2639214.1 cobalamin biosynthesis protein [Methanothrix sp.]MDI9399456.1 cobalamin biosynthesis protein [Euryarchaeota archaeon]KUK94290.1 MAG: putative cobalamin biosynthesis protein CobD [Methanothrix harundinacea]